MTDAELAAANDALRAKHKDEERELLVKRYGACKFHKDHGDTFSFWFGGFLGFMFGGVIVGLIIDYANKVAH